MGCGKTTTGKKLAKKLGYSFLDLDKEIEKQQKNTIAQIFESKGEDYFRKLEHQFLTDFNLNKNTVVSCGGGTPCFYNNMEMMNKIGYTVYIQMTTEALFSRLKQITPPLSSSQSCPRKLEGIRRLSNIVLYVTFRTNMIQKLFCQLPPFHQVAEMGAAKMDQESFGKHAVEKSEKVLQHLAMARYH